MDHPDWYPAWRHDAVHQLQEKNARLSAEFHLGDWPRYDYDIDAGTLILSDKGAAKVVAGIQIAGSTSAKAHDWLWAWGNSDLPPECIADSQIVRAFGEEHGICELTHDSVTDEDLNALGWALTSVMSRLTDAFGAYRPPRDEGGALYLIYKNMTWVS